MEAKHWIGLGCGGCLGIILLIVAIIAGSIFYVRNITRNAEQSYQEMNALKDKHPFSTPANEQIDPERFNRFLTAREKTYADCKDCFAPFSEFVEIDINKNNFSQFKIFTSVMTILTQVPKINKSRLESLKAAEMSPQEYKYWTSIMALEISTWEKLQDQPDKIKLAEQYFHPLKKFEENAKAISARKPGTNLDNSPFDYDTFIHRIEKKEYKNDKNSETVFAQKDRIVSSTSAIFLDAWTLDFTNN